LKLRFWIEFRRSFIDSCPYRVVLFIKCTLVAPELPKNVADVDGDEDGKEYVIRGRGRFASAEFELENAKLDGTGDIVSSE
jgi:hypothetical protein